MLNLVRTLSLILLLLLIAFPASADNGLSSLSLAFERLLILLVWSLGSLALLIVSFIRYRRRKTITPALLVYLSFVSVALLYTVVFYHFMDQSGSLIFDDTIDTMERDSDIAIYRVMIGFGGVLVAAIVAFGVYHWKSGRKG